MSVSHEDILERLTILFRKRKPVIVVDEFQW